MVVAQSFARIFFRNCVATCADRPTFHLTSPDSCASKIKQNFSATTCIACWRALNPMAKCKKWHVAVSATNCLVCMSKQLMHVACVIMCTLGTFARGQRKWWHRSFELVLSLLCQQHRSPMVHLALAVHHYTSCLVGCI